MVARSLLLMVFADMLTEALTLQNDWTSRGADPAMVRRRELVETEIPQWLQPELATFPTWIAKGSNGKGGAAEVPWTRIFDPESSPKAGIGWYLVYLFDAKGESVYLSLIQGTTQWNTIRKDFDYVPEEILSDRVAWAVDVLTATGLRKRNPIDWLSDGRLGRIYKLGSVHAIRYDRDAMPSDARLRTDMLSIGQLLAAIYEASAKTAYLPGEVPPEIAMVEAAAEGRSRPRRGGQGFGANSVENKIVELHAVASAREYFEGLGYKVRDTGSNNPFDLEATKGDAKVRIEVKGTVSPGDQIQLTYGEVKFQLKAYPNNALVVVHSIQLDRTQTPPKASGGVRQVTQPWALDESALQPISYMYTVRGR